MCTAILRDISTLHVTSYKMSLMIIAICPIHTYSDILKTFCLSFRPAFQNSLLKGPFSNTCIFVAWKRRLGVDRKLKRRNDIRFQKRPNMCERGHGKTIIIHTRKC